MLKKSTKVIVSVNILKASSSIIYFSSIIYLSTLNLLYEIAFHLLENNWTVQIIETTIDGVRIN